jgi:hypothetical protein
MTFTSNSCEPLRLAPWAAGKIAAHHGDHLPFYIGAAAIAAAIGVLATGHRLLDHAESVQALPEPLDSQADLLVPEGEAA